MSEWYDTLKDLTAGTIGGCAGIVVGQPLDTIKVRLQAQGISSLPGAMTYNGPLDALAKMIRHEGPRSLFKGLLPPLLGNAPMNAIAFGAYGNANRMLDPIFPNTPLSAEVVRPPTALTNQLLADLQAKFSPSLTPEYLAHKSTYTSSVQNPNFPRLFLAGCWAGLLQCLATTPAELIKCKLQAQEEGKRVYNGMWDCAKQMVKQKGWSRGLYSGWWTTVWRDTPGMGAYFVFYEMSKWLLRSDKYAPEVSASAPQSSAFNEIPISVKWTHSVEYTVPCLLAAGAMGGIASWVFTYPFDVIKSVIQTLPDNADPKDSKIINVAKANYQKYGSSFFFRGLGTTIVRAIPVNAVTFYVYEECLKRMSAFDKYVVKA